MPEATVKKGQEGARACTDRYWRKVHSFEYLFNVFEWAFKKPHLFIICF